MQRPREELTVSRKHYFLTLSSISSNITLVKQWILFFSEFSGNDTVLDSQGIESHFIRMML